MSRLRVKTSGRTTVYVCEDTEAGLPMHAHAPGEGHDVHCLAGSILVYVHPGERHVLSAGETFAFPDPTKFHGVVALTAGATFVNTYEVDQTPFASVLESPHKAPAWAMA